MISRAKHCLRQFRMREDGNSTVEFAIVIPAFIMILMSTVELGMINLRHSQLERALDGTVRTIRLGTGDRLVLDALAIAWNVARASTRSAQATANSHHRFRAPRGP